MTQYIQLRSSTSEEVLLQTLENDQVTRHHPKAYEGNVKDGLLFWTCAATILSTSLSIVVLLTTLMGGSNNYPDMSHTEPTRPLRRPSTYINLEKALIKSNHTFPPLSNFPQVVYQISSSDPHRRMTENTTRSWSASIGTVYPDARRIFITEKASTILQFRHIDFGMENCSLRYSIPPLTPAFSPSTHVHASTIIDIWNLETVGEISRYIGNTWKYAPQRGKKLGTISLEDPQPSSSTFLCRSNQFSTFELACSPNSSGCYLDFWQDQRTEPKAGIYLIQEQTNIEIN